MLGGNQAVSYSIFHSLANNAILLFYSITKICLTCREKIRNFMSQLSSKSTRERERD
ncbi:hypothetical protein BCV71DRAFT_48141 [Rhizopus microsporus]|uniref:Uncharacterized protein n=1 Tax=Rhizopus microsporus TaxID=58291 RepID=A0A1X0RRK9_RHIZD|nr:hypothetical protein BCV71DRAFT_48141 [Rhizopus microsporus]